MEEWIGERWHRFITARVERANPQAAALADVQRAARMLLHAGGGHQRLAIAPAIGVGGQRRFLQRVAGSGTRADIAQLDDDALALPEACGAYADAALNAELYLWWAALAAHWAAGDAWASGNVQAARAALADMPGLRPVAERLVAAELDRRSALPGAASPAEAQVRRALAAMLSPPASSWPEEGAALAPRHVAAVWPWLVVWPSTRLGEAPHADALRDSAAQARGKDGREGRDAAEQIKARRRAERKDFDKARAPLLLAHKGESIRTFGDAMSLDRGEDDDDDEASAATAAEELEHITLQRGGVAKAARVRFDLDLPAAAQDDTPVGEGIRLPEWDWRARALKHDQVLAQVFTPRAQTPWAPSAALKAASARVRRKLAIQRAARQWQRGALEGEEIDLDAWVQRQGERASGHDGPEGVFMRHVKLARDMATLLLADLSLSTEAHANNEQRVIDVIREALFQFGEALSGTGDAFAMLGFSSVRRTLRLNEIKGFDERFGSAMWPRLGALKPGYYTRMGAAIRAATLRLAVRPERQRLLLLLTDGKPHDQDHYDGRWGVEDTRHAIRAARAAGLLPFAISIDDCAPQVMPELFGAKGWVWVRRPADLPLRLSALYAQLAR